MNAATSSPGASPGASLGAALVTGAGRRLGLAIADGLAAAGWAVAYHYGRSGDAAQAAAEAVNAAGGTAAAVGADLADMSEVETLVPRAAEALGRQLDLLVHNAAVFRRDSLSDTTPASWAHHMAVNVTALVFLTQAFAAQLPEEAQGNVIAILDQRVVNPTPHYMSYAASKATLWSLVGTWALALAPAIRVNAIGPGMALPDHGHDTADMAQWTERYPLRQGTSPEQINAAIRFILDAPAMTGQMIVLDGGQHLGWLHPQGGYPLKP